MTGHVRVRFAPSPTGELHVGNARTALFNWLFARRHGGRFVLRIEDTDRERAAPVYEEHLCEDLAWLGIDWDEGPDRPGERGPYRQSERLPVYEAALHRLQARGAVYPCFCSEEELAAERQALLARGLAPRYGGTCRRFTDGDRRRLEAEGRTKTIRFRVPPGRILFRDLIRGEMVFDGDSIGDFIIVRSNGVPAYNFAAVADDHGMDITHVIRGEDHLSNTAMQILLYRALGFDPPLFAHHALILGRDRTKLGKRHGAVAVREFRSRGILAEALVNELAILGGGLGEGREACTRSEMIREFSLERISRSGAVFDEEKLHWLNAQAIRSLDVPALVARLAPFMKKAGYGTDRADPERIARAVRLVQPNLATLADIGDHLDMLSEDRFSLTEEARTCLSGSSARAVLEVAYAFLSSGTPDSPAGFRQMMREIGDRTGARGKAAYLPLRAAVTGRLHGPELPDIFIFLGEALLRKRMASALDFPPAPSPPGHPPDPPRPEN